mmetsp:Transcript_55846/g.86791  ORF Transcript_55846/g.86791 Transcript_55846/m.86791 type:complete len:305 (+) Transcript_55846:102-1016(+)
MAQDGEGEPPALDAEEEDEPPPRRLIESTLWREDVFTLEHRSVWGSWYDPQVKRWGYACCHGIQKERPCTAPAPDDGAQNGKPESSEEYSPDSDVEKEARFNFLQDAPPELLPREKFNKASDYIEHFVRFAIYAWHQEQEKGFVGFGDIERQAFEKTLQETVAAVTPLLKRLRRGETLEKGERKETRGRCRETRTSMEGKFIQEASVLGQLELMVKNAYDRDYASAHKAYMRLTLGNKTWNSTNVLHVAACTMKGAREYRRNRDNLNTYDMDPVSQRYMHAMRKLVHFTQMIRRNPDQSKNLVL